MSGGKTKASGPFGPGKSKAGRTVARHVAHIPPASLISGAATTRPQVHPPAKASGQIARGRVLGSLQRRGGSARADMMYHYIMQRTQISLTSEGRRALDAAAARTGRSISALIRDAVETVYGGERSIDDDLAAMRQAFGSWKDRDLDGAAWVDQLRSGSRLQQGSS